MITVGDTKAGRVRKNFKFTGIPVWAGRVVSTILNIGYWNLGTGLALIISLSMLLRNLCNWFKNQSCLLCNNYTGWHLPAILYFPCQMHNIKHSTSIIPPQQNWMIIRNNRSVKIPSLENIWRQKFNVQKFKKIKNV